METSYNQNYRLSNPTETAIFNRTKKVYYSLYREAFIVFISMALIILPLCFIAFRKNFFAGSLMLFLLIVTISFSILIGRILKKNAAEKSYKIYADKGEWIYQLEGHGKTAQYVSRINGYKTAMILSQFHETPTIKKSEYIEYEYVTIFDPPPTFGYGRFFVSIGDHKLTERHKEVFFKTTPTSIISIILSAAFVVSLIFNVGIKFESIEVIGVSIFTLYFFYRTVRGFVNNKTLGKTITKKKFDN